MNLFALPPFITDILIFLIGLLVILKSSRTRTNIIFFLFCLSMNIWLTFYTLMYISLDPVQAIIFARLGFLGIIFIPLLAYHFIVTFLNQAPQKRVLIPLYTVGLSSVFATPTNLVYNGVAVYFWGFYPTAGSLYFIFLAAFAILFTYGIILLLLGYIRAKKQADFIKAQQISYVLIAFACGTTGLVDYIIKYRLPIYPFGYISAFLFIGVIAFAITKTRLMDISVIISRALAEIIAISIHAVVYLSVTWIYMNYVSKTIDPLFIAFTIIYGIFVGQTHQQIRLFMQTAADKLFIRGKYDYYKSLAEASSRVCEQLSLEHILRVLYDTFHEVVEISNPRVFLPDNFSTPEKTSNFYVAYDKQTLNPAAGSEKIKIDATIIKELISSRQPVQNVKELNAALVVPCILEDRLIAFFALGRKLSEDPYTEEDLRLLQALGSQTAVELDHSRSYEKIKTELEAAVKELERSQRLASIGTLTAGVTHEIRNPLTVIRAETERITNQARDLEYLKQFRELVLKHITRIENIVLRMLKLAKEKPRQETSVDLNKEIEDVISFIKFDGVKLDKKLQPIPAIRGDAEEIEQVFVNLIQNAIEAMPNGGTLTIRTLQKNNKPMVEISDTGKGIPPEIAESIFDPFFSTRHEGTGLGLSIAYRIVREHGGDIKVTSELGKGSTFRITFAS